ncbi:MAG: hypothetical protein FJ318_09975 [SAR202 cluster bacterium]|nr:hypothetical protein [SAR202 cluster bacterium]
MTRLLQATLLIAAPPKQAWRALLDFPSRERHSRRVQQVDLIGEGPLRVGSRFKLKVDGRTLMPEVAEMMELQRLALRITAPGMSIDHVYELRAIGGDTSVTIVGRYGGVFGSVMGKLMPRSFLRDLEDELAAIKSAAEI